ncbi:MFS transporter [Oceanobacillus iheyensis]|nr:MFS transporter [Oceanobacillus iheyensis]
MEPQLNNLNGGSTRPFGYKDKFGYLLGDFGNDFTFILVSGYLMVFYTDIFGLNAAAVGTLFMVARFWDAITDVLLGRFIDSRKATKNGKFKPWIARMSLPVVISCVLLFLPIGGMNDGFLLAYAYVTYILYGMMYTGVNIPYGSMAAVISGDSVHRTSLSGWRTMGATSANLAINALAPLIIFVDNELSANRVFMVTVVFAVLAFACYMGCVKLTQERIVNPESKPGEKSIFKTLKGIGKNVPFITILIASLLFMMNMLLVMTVNVYLFKDYFGSAGVMSIFGLLQGGTTFLAMPTLARLVKKFGKKEVGLAGLFIAGFVYVLLFFMQGLSLVPFLLIYTIGLIGFSYYNLILWAYVTDALDYQEYLVGTREDGTVYAIFTFVRKIGSALAGGLGGFALAYIGYNSGAPSQTEEVKDGIYMLGTLVPGIIYLVVFFILFFFYPLNKKRTEAFSAELAERRANKASQ